MAEPTKPAPTKPGAKKPGTIMGLPWWAWGLAIVAGLAVGYFLLRPRSAQAGDSSDATPPAAESPARGGSGGGAGLGLPGEGLPGSGGGGSAPTTSGDGGGGFGGGDFASSEVPPPEEYLADPGTATITPAMDTAAMQVQERDDTPLGQLSIVSDRPGVTSDFVVLSDTTVHSQSGTTGGRHEV